MTHAINRRKALTVVASAPAAVALAAVPAFASVEGPSELAGLVRRYFAETADFNRIAVQDGRTDDDNDALADATYETTLERMIGVPARSAEDALAALDWLVKEEADFGTDYDQGEDDDDALGQHVQVVTSLVDAIRGYIEGKVENAPAWPNSPRGANQLGSEWLRIRADT
jgi:hypothetical protein